MVPSPQLTELETEVRVGSVDRLTSDVVSLTLAPTQGAVAPWTAGAHVDVVLPDGIVRQYSLCGSVSDDEHYRIAVLREPSGRGGSAAVHELREGDLLRVRGPRNHFAFGNAPSYVFVAGGIGITPLLPMIEVAEAAGADWQLHYGGRSRDSMAFLEHLTSYGDRVSIVPQDEQGLLDVAGILGTPRQATQVYCCGPEPLIAAVEAACASWPSGALHVERFAAKEQAESGEDHDFDLVLQRSGRTIRVPAGTTIFEAMREAGLSVLGSCLEGICGTCEQGVLEGEVDHRDSVLDEEERAENDCLMVCVSRALTDRLVLDA